MNKRLRIIRLRIDVILLTVQIFILMLFKAFYVFWIILSGSFVNHVPDEPANPTERKSRKVIPGPPTPTILLNFRISVVGSLFDPRNQHDLDLAMRKIVKLLSE